MNVERERIRGSDRAPGVQRRGASGITLALVVVAAGCGGNDGSVGIGSGQDPDPVAIDFPIAYTKGPLFDAQMQLLSSSDVRDVLRFNVGTDLYMRERASPTAIESNITIRETQGLGDVMGAEISVDGSRILFAMRGPFDPNLADDEQPTWNIWEYDIPSDTLVRQHPRFRSRRDGVRREDGEDQPPGARGSRRRRRRRGCADRAGRFLRATLVGLRRDLLLRPELLRAGARAGEARQRGGPGSRSHHRL